MIDLDQGERGFGLEPGRGVVRYTRPCVWVFVWVCHRYFCDCIFVSGLKKKRGYRVQRRRRTRLALTGKSMRMKALAWERETKRNGVRVRHDKGDPAQPLYVHGAENGNGYTVA